MKHIGVLILLLLHAVHLIGVNLHRGFAAKAQQRLLLYLGDSPAAFSQGYRKLLCPFPVQHHAGHCLQGVILRGLRKGNGAHLAALGGNALTEKFRFQGNRPVKGHLLPVFIPQAHLQQGVEGILLILHGLFQLGLALGKLLGSSKRSTTRWVPSGNSPSTFTFKVASS